MRMLFSSGCCLKLVERLGVLNPEYLSKERFSSFGSIGRACRSTIIQVLAGFAFAEASASVASASEAPPSATEIAFTIATSRSTIFGLDVTYKISEGYGSWTSPLRTWKERIAFNSTQLRIERAISVIHQGREPREWLGVFWCDGTRSAAVADYIGEISVDPAKVGFPSADLGSDCFVLLQWFPILPEITEPDFRDLDRELTSATTRVRSELEVIEDGTLCAVADIYADDPGEFSATHLVRSIWMDKTRDWVPRRVVNWVANQGSHPADIYSEWRADTFLAIAPGIWVPTEAIFERYRMVPTIADPVGKLGPFVRVISLAGAAAPAVAVGAIDGVSHVPEGALLTDLDSGFEWIAMKDESERIASTFGMLRGRLLNNHDVEKHQRVATVAAPAADRAPRIVEYGLLTIVATAAGFSIAGRLGFRQSRSAGVAKRLIP